MPNGGEVQEQDENVQDGEIIKVSMDTDDDSTGEDVSEAQEPAEEHGDTDKVEPVERPVYTMPVAKAQEEKQRAVEKAREEARLEKEREVARIKEEYERKLNENRPKDDYEQELERIASEEGLNTAAVSKLMNAVKKEISKSLPDTSKYDAILKENEIRAIKQQVTEEFDTKVAPLLLKDFPQATPEHIQGVKERIAELAFTKDYNTYRLEDIYKVNKETFQFKNGYSAEPSGGRSSEIVDFSKVTDEDEIAMAKNSPETYRKFLKWQESNSSKYLD